jgi:hypothetical protein
MGFLVKERIKNVIKKKLTINWDQFKSTSFDMGILVVDAANTIQRVLLKGGSNEGSLSAQVVVG